MVSDGTNVLIRQNNVLTSGVTYNYEAVVTGAVAGTMQLTDYAAAAIYDSFIAVTTYTGSFIANDAGIQLKRAGVSDITLASLRIWR